MEEILPPPSAAAGPSARGWSLRRLGLWLFLAQLWTIWGIALSNALLGLASLTGLRYAWKERPRLDAFMPLLRPLGWFSFLFVVSALYSTHPSLSARKLVDLLNLQPVLLAALFIREERALRRVVDSLIGLGVVAAAYGLGQVAFGVADIDTARRMPGPFSHYQTFAGILALSDSLLLASMLYGGRWRRWPAWVSLVLINLALAGNLTRGSWIAFGGAIVLLLVMRRPRNLLFLLPLAAVLLVLLPRPVLDRGASIFDLRDASNYDRLAMANAGLRMLSERPLFGQGPGTVGERYPIYRHPTAINLERPHLHDTYLQMGAETGLLTLAAFVWLLAACARRLFSRYHREGGSRGPRADLYLGVAAALLAYTLAGLFEDNWSDTEVQRVALVLLALPFCMPSSDEPGDELSSVPESLPD